MSEDDEKLVMDILQIYFDGNAELNAKKILSAWDPNLKIISTEKTVGPEGWIEMERDYKEQIKGDLTKWRIQFEIQSMDVFKNCASVKVGVKYGVAEKTFGETQFLHLLKDDGSWLIYSKIFTFYPSLYAYHLYRS